MFSNIEYKNTNKDSFKDLKISKSDYYKELVLDKVDNIYEYAIVFKGKNAIVR